jgi:hypothetical protein
MTGPIKRAEQRMEVFKNTTVETVKKNGSSGQKLMVNLFDKDRNGILDEQEAKHFNSCRFTTEDNKITMYYTREDGTQKVTEIIYSNPEQICDMYNGHALNTLSRFDFDANGKHCKAYLYADYNKATIDMTTGTVTIEGGGGSADRITGRNIKLNVTDCSLKYITMHGGELNVKNTKNVGLLWDSATKVSTDGKTIIKQDNESKIKVN